MYAHILLLSGVAKGVQGVVAALGSRSWGATKRGQKRVSTPALNLYWAAAVLLPTGVWEGNSLAVSAPAVSNRSRILARMFWFCAKGSNVF